MSVEIAEIIWLDVGVYLLIGAGYAGWLMAGAMKRIDPLAAAAPWPVKLLIAPGIVALWPLFARKLSRAQP